MNVGISQTALTMSKSNKRRRLIITSSSERPTYGSLVKVSIVCRRFASAAGWSQRPILAWEIFHGHDMSAFPDPGFAVWLSS
jgi:hypothetical protein